MSEKAAILMLDLSGKFPKLIPLVTEEGKLLLTTSEKVAERYVKAFQAANPKMVVVFFGMVGDPTPFFNAIKKEMKR